MSLLLTALMVCALCIPAMAEGTDALEEPLPAAVETNSEETKEPVSAEGPIEPIEDKPSRNKCTSKYIAYDYGER